MFSEFHVEDLIILSCAAF